MEDQILRHERGQGRNHFPCSAIHEQGLEALPGCSLLLLYMVIIHTYSGIYVLAIYTIWEIFVFRQGTCSTVIIPYQIDQ